MDMLSNCYASLPRAILKRVLKTTKMQADYNMNRTPSQLHPGIWDPVFLGLLPGALFSTRTFPVQVFERTRG